MSKKEVLKSINIRAELKELENLDPDDFESWAIDGYGDLPGKLTLRLEQTSGVVTEVEVETEFGGLAMAGYGVKSRSKQIAVPTWERQWECSFESAFGDLDMAFDLLLSQLTKELLDTLRKTLEHYLDDIEDDDLETIFAADLIPESNHGIGLVHWETIGGLEPGLERAAENNFVARIIAAGGYYSEPELYAIASNATELNQSELMKGCIRVIAHLQRNHP